MNKTAIKNFAIEARKKLIADVRYRAGLVGITEQGIKTALPQSNNTTEFYDIGTTNPYAISGEAIRQRKNLAESIRRRAADAEYAAAYQYIMEEVAYTWFNRLIAVRFMEVNEYLPGKVRVLSSERGKIEPDLVTDPFGSDLTFTAEEEQTILQMKQGNQLDELFRLLFIKQCNALHDILPALFEQTEDYTELLLNLSVVDQESVVWHLTHDIPEDDFNVEKGGQVEIIGWLYQYYNTEPKAQVFARPSGQKIKKEEIPAATQLFTPDWIVRYMVENSLGRLWLEGHPDGGLRSGWKYYLDEAKQEPEVQAQLDEIRAERRTLTPEEIKVIDPCMGSGHILVYAFDVLMQIYEKAGWERREAAQNIVRRNLYGLDIDKRAWQLAYFAVMMKAREHDRKFFSRGIQPQVYYPGGDKNLEEFGSLVLVDDPGRMPEGPETMFDMVGYENRLNAWSYRYLLAQKYDVVVTNPPYMGGAGMSGKLSEFVKKNFPDGKGDLFSCFMEKADKLVRPHGFTSLITMESWMFLSSFETLRKKTIQAKTIINMVHMPYLGKGGTSLGINFGTAAVIMQKGRIKDYSAQYEYTVYYECDENGVPFEFPTKNERWKTAKQANFFQIPGSPIAYWVSKKMLYSFEIGVPLGEIAKPRQGMATTNNNMFLRLWFEVSNKDMCLHAKNKNEAIINKKKWFPYNKGGDYRKWYGNNDYLVIWENDGHSIKKYLIGKNPNIPRGETLYFKKCFSWSLISSAKPAFRYKDYGNIFDIAGMSCFSDDHLIYLLALCNSKIANAFLAVFSPTINFQAGDIANIPVILDNAQFGEIEMLSRFNINISKVDWDSFETSWDFTRHSLVRGASTVAEAYTAWEAECNNRFTQLKANEEELNRIFIDIYGLQNELTPDVEDKDVTVRRADLGRDIRSLLSYAVGCIFGRYSLDTPGLAYAGGEWDAGKYSSFLPDADNIIPLTDEAYLEDDVVKRLCEWLRAVYGPDTLEENLDFIAKALGNKGATSREVIRNYFLKDFFADHCKIYQKRPIYWLFDSGKQNGFKALVYLHRYTPDTIGKLRVDYLHPLQRVYASEIERMRDMIDNSKNQREVAVSAKRKEKLQKQLKECREYDEKIAHLALARIVLDLDDGVKVNYRKIQTASDGKLYEVLANSKDIMAKK